MATAKVILAELLQKIKKLHKRMNNYTVTCDKIIVCFVLEPITREQLRELTILMN